MTAGGACLAGSLLLLWMVRLANGSMPDTRRTSEDSTHPRENPLAGGRPHINAVSPGRARARPVARCDKMAPLRYKGTRRASPRTALSEARLAVVTIAP